MIITQTNLLALGSGATKYTGKFAEPQKFPEIFTIDSFDGAGNALLTFYDANNNIITTGGVQRTGVKYFQTQQVWLIDLTS